MPGEVIHRRNVSLFGDKHFKLRSSDYWNKKII